MRDCARSRKHTQTTLATPVVIPRPVKLVLQAGHFEVGPATAVGVVSGADEAREAAAFLCDWLTQATGGARPVNTFVDEERPRGIIFTKRGAKPEWGEEGYGLEITSKQVLIRANSAAGFFYGVETLRQLLPPGAESVAGSHGTREWNAPVRQDRGFSPLWLARLDARQQPALSGARNSSSTCST